MNRLVLASCLTVCCALFCAHAADTANVEDIPPSTLERDVHLFVVQADGSVEERDDSTLRANTTSGVDDIAQRYVWFNKDIDRKSVV